MNYQKIDAALAAALEEVQDPYERSLAVFIFTTGGFEKKKTATLEDLGVSTLYVERSTFTATLSPLWVETLTEEPWVRYLKLSRKLKFAAEERHGESPDFIPPNQGTNDPENSQADHLPSA